MGRVGGMARFLWSSGFSKGLLSALSHAANSLSFPKLSFLASVNCGSLVAPLPLRPHLPDTSFSFDHCLGPVLGFPVFTLPFHPGWSPGPPFSLSTHPPPISNSINDLFPESLELIYFLYVNKHIWSAYCVLNTLQVLIYLIIIIMLWVLSHFTDEEIEIQSSYVICPSSRGATEASIGIVSMSLCLSTSQEVNISLRGVTLPACAHSHVSNTQHRVWAQ